MKSSLKDLIPKGILKFQKALQKKAFTHPNTLVTIYFHSHFNKRPYELSKSKPNGALIYSFHVLLFAIEMVNDQFAIICT